MSGGAYELDFRAVHEDEPGEKWRALFEELWPAYRQWFLSEGERARPTYAASVRALRASMPQLEPLYERLVELAGGGDIEARFLSLYRPPPFLVGCSQAIWSRDGEVALVRNYDFAPDLCDGIIQSTAWSGRRVIAMGDCLWGALDGMNQDGLAVALAFSGRRVIGEGFAITLILRYVLETCACAAEAEAALERIPPHMAYNVSVVDAAGEGFVAFLSPDGPPRVQRRRASTNHADASDWPEYAAATESVERLCVLEERLADPAETLATFVARFLQPPLYRTAWDRHRGTLYTAVYRPRQRTVEYRWPGHVWGLGFDGFEEGTYTARYDAAAVPARAPGQTASS